MAYRALLIGASTYDDPAIGDLPFVPEDLRQLHAALSARGFASVEVLEAPRGIIRTTVNARVGGFLREARRDDVLLVVLSGHGQRFEGTDYLIPEDASFAIRPFAECCVAIDWQRELEDSAAAQVLFLVDACREGFARDTMSPVGVRGWGGQRIAAALRRKVGYLYACSPAQVALFVKPNEQAADGTSPGESFSLFSRAVAGVVAELPHAMDLGEFHRQVQERVTALHRAYAKPGSPQAVRLATDLDGADFTVLPGPPKDAGVHPWVRSVTGHAAWERTAAGPAREAIQEAAEELAAQLARAYDESGAVLTDDPWHDAQLATRTQERANFLVRGLDPATAFSPTEAALLALLPLVTQAYWARQAASRAAVLDGTAPRPEQDRFQAFTRSHPRLVRRLAALDQTAEPHGDAARIRWWLHHRWLLHQPELYTGGALAALLALPDRPERPAWCSGALGPARFAHFLQDQRQAPFAHPQGPALPDTVAASTGHEHMVRQDVVGALAKTAHALAVDPVDLSEIVAEHLGISDAVDTGALLATLRGSDWRGAGAGRSLNAECGHPAVQIALREHATRTDALLRDISRGAAGGPLHALPAYADADRVRLTGGAAHHLTEGIRFQLAEDRVQELLMGESLYSDRDLAVRELYQNALDALRHRDARTQYLTRTNSGRRLPPWTGAITFRQGIAPDGRGYLECHDNGVGMGVTEIARAFAQGGARFVDLPEYAEEQAEWSQLDPPVQLFPNSRFGIGVLSYFMLADEIEVRTCRMSREGRPGRQLRVTIAGPGNLFRVEDLGEGDEPGTVVRLLLSRGRAPVSVVDVLEQVLWVAQYRTTAEQGARRGVWEAGVLADAAGAGQPPVASGHPDLWWTDEAGQLMADGLFVKCSGVHDLLPYGVLVNLHGPHQPELTVDRAEVIAFSRDHAVRLACEAAARESASAARMANWYWTAKVSTDSPQVGDAVIAAAARTGRS
ncbi:caspase family protein [Streptomyces sp. NPDC021020]|uniref:HD domain-containing protein n=1 Tax=Streptomyces sp. NPDC021020 TaxID=3365109 RepID=UPI003799D3D9